MGNHHTRDNFEWTDQEEPHAKRRVEILSKLKILNRVTKINFDLALSKYCTKVSYFLNAVYNDIEACIQKKGVLYYN